MNTTLIKHFNRKHSHFLRLIIRFQVNTSMMYHIFIIE